MTPPAARYKDDPQLVSFANRLLERVRSLPGVEAAGITSNIPLGSDFNDSVILAEGYVMAPGESVISPINTQVTPGYFEAMRVPLKRGRYLPGLGRCRGAEGGHRRRAPGGAVLRRQGPNWTEAVASGQCGRAHQGSGQEFSVLHDRRSGRRRPVARADRKRRGRRLLLSCRAGCDQDDDAGRRSSTDPERLTQTIRAEITAIDPELPFYGTRPMQSRIDQSLVSRRTPMLLGSSFAVIAVFLACVGIYGVLAYQVAQRRREIGIRLALGSEPAGIFKLVIREGLLLVVAGLPIGFGGAVAIRRALETQLFGIGALDPLVLSMVTGTLALVALIACGLPARRASRIDPLIALTDQ